MTVTASDERSEGERDGAPVARVKRSWKDSDRFVPRAVVRPALRFTEVEAAGAIVMLAAAVVALVWANSAWDGGYESFLTTPVRLQLGGIVKLDFDLHDAVNQGLMTLFFLLAGLEIKRQLVTGELRDRRAAALPAIAALGGMIVPALIYTAFNAGHAGSQGWGIPVATDIAFAVAVVTLAGPRVPLGARIFILTLAVVDDVGGIIVIAIFYADGVRFWWLALAALTVLAAVAVQRRDMRSMTPYLFLGVICWYALYRCGVEAAIAGVVFGLLTPTKPFHDPAHFAEVSRALVDRIEDADEVAVEDLARYATETASPLERIENRLNLWVAFAIVPLFALVNAGVRIGGTRLDRRVVLGVFFGLVVGKTIGVFGGAWLAVRTGIGKLPTSVSWRHVFGLAATAGIGFTVALFVTSLSFDDEALTSSAKVGILIASATAGVLGIILLRTVAPSPPVEGDLDPAEPSGGAGQPTAAEPLNP